MYCVGGAAAVEEHDGSGEGSGELEVTKITQAPLLNEDETSEPESAEDDSDEGEDEDEDDNSTLLNTTDGKPSRRKL